MCKLQCESCLGDGTICSDYEVIRVIFTFRCLQVESDVQPHSIASHQHSKRSGGVPQRSGRAGEEVSFVRTWCVEKSFATNVSLYIFPFFPDFQWSATGYFSGCTRLCDACADVVVIVIVFSINRVVDSTLIGFVTSWFPWQWKNHFLLHSL